MKITLLFSVSLSEVWNYHALKCRISPLLYQYIKKLWLSLSFHCVIEAFNYMFSMALREVCQDVWYFNLMVMQIQLIGLPVCFIRKYNCFLSLNDIFLLGFSGIS